MSHVSLIYHVDKNTGAQVGLITVVVVLVICLGLILPILVVVLYLYFKNLKILKKEGMSRYYILKHTTSFEKFYVLCRLGILVTRQFYI